MEKVNYEEGWLNNLSREEIVKNFLVQLVENKSKSFGRKITKAQRQQNLEDEKKYFLDNIVFKDRYLCDPRAAKLEVYIRLGDFRFQEQIDKLLSFEKEYVSCKKEIRKIKKIGKETISVDLEVYHIQYADCKNITFTVVKGYDKELDYVITEDHLNDLKSQISGSAYLNKKGVML